MKKICPLFCLLLFFSIWPFLKKKILAKFVLLNFFGPGNPDSNNNTRHFYTTGSHMLHFTLKITVLKTYWLWSVKGFRKKVYFEAYFLHSQTEKVLVTLCKSQFQSTLGCHKIFKFPLKQKNLLITFTVITTKSKY